MNFLMISYNSFKQSKGNVLDSCSNNWGKGLFICRLRFQLLLSKVYTFVSEDIH